MTAESIATDVSPKLPATTLFGRAKRWAGVRILFELGGLTFALIVVALLVKLLMRAATPAARPVLEIAANLLMIPIILFVYSLLVRWLEQRRAAEISLGAGVLQLPMGFMGGMGLMATVYAGFWALEMTSFAPGAGVGAILAGLPAVLLGATVEELMLRAVVFRNVEAARGTTVALIVSAAIFGGLHAMNPGATLLGVVAIAVEAGLLLGLAYAFTRNLWLAIGIHAGWNFAEGSLFGAHVSGQPISSSWVVSTLSGPDYLTGGAFGPEASVVAVAAGGLAALALGFAVVRRGEWRSLRSKGSTSSAPRQAVDLG